MFQYAAASSLAQKHGVPIRLDISDFGRFKAHNGFELNQVFQLKIPIATIDDVYSILGWQGASAVRRKLALPLFKRLRCKNYIVEPHFQYWQYINDVLAPSYLHGYWQSEKYFADSSEKIRGEFEFRGEMSPANLRVAEKICAAKNSVSLHVRRGDYAIEPRTKAIHGLCSISYYYDAIKYISDRIENPMFFVFSDDIPWVKKNLVIHHARVYIDYNKGVESYNDMHLMSLCRNQIIANSSFSWWGAWLNPVADRIVIAPKYWFAMKVDTSDLIPNEWVRL